jgi:hypothetical protein
MVEKEKEKVVESISVTPQVGSIVEEMPQQPILSKAARKQERGEKVKFPWKNSDKIETLKVNLIHYEISASDVPFTPSEEVCVENGPDTDKVVVYALHTLPYILAMVRNNPEKLFLDTGSHLNLASYEFFADEKISPVRGIELTSASSHVIPMEGKVTLKVTVGNIEIPCQFVLIKGLEMKLLLGNSVFDTYDMILNYPEKQCEFTYKGKSSGSIPLLLLKNTPPVLSEE